MTAFIPKNEKYQLKAIKLKNGDFSRIFPIFSTFRRSVFMNPLKWKCFKHGV